MSECVCKFCLYMGLSVLLCLIRSHIHVHDEKYFYYRCLNYFKAILYKCLLLIMY